MDDLIADRDSFIQLFNLRSTIARPMKSYTSEGPLIGGESALNVRLTFDFEDDGQQEQIVAKGTKADELASK